MPPRVCLAAAVPSVDAHLAMRYSYCAQENRRLLAHTNFIMPQKKMGIPDCRIRTTSGGGSCQRSTAWPVSCGRMAIGSYSEISTMFAVSYIEHLPRSLATRAHALRHETVVALLVDGLGRQFRVVTSTSGRRRGELHYEVGRQQISRPSL